MKRVPKVGEILPAFDDGKISSSRLYITEIKEVIPFEKAKLIKVLARTLEGELRDDINLTDAWIAEKEEIDWLFSDNTDYFIRANVKGDVLEDQWFARTKDGGWFSMGIADSLVGARLDSDMELFNSWSDPECFNYKTYLELKNKFKMLYDEKKDTTI